MAYKIEKANLRYFEAEDDRGYYVGLEEFDGRRWLNCGHKRPTFLTVDAAEYYINARTAK